MKVKFIFLLILVSILSLILYSDYVVKKNESFEQGMSEFKQEHFKLALIKLEPYAYEGNRLARRHIGIIYALGLEVPINNILAETFFSCKGIENCIEGEAECVVSYFFKNGTFGKKDHNKARYWLDISIHKGYNQIPCKE